MEFENLAVESDGQVATITLNRPASRNARSEGLLTDYENALIGLNRGDWVRVIRVRGAGRAFSSGYDLAAPTGSAATGRAASGVGPEAVGDGLADLGESLTLREREGMRRDVDGWLKLWNYLKPIVAQVHGHCLSAGLGLLAATDLAFAATGGTASDRAARSRTGRRTHVARRHRSHPVRHSRPATCRRRNGDGRAGRQISARVHLGDQWSAQGLHLRRRLPAAHRCCPSAGPVR
jgi:1,4-dihydroxy-2-naphthoyl-CoA synthase